MTALRKLLVVDDDPVVGASFKRVLSGKGYLVVEAGNGTEALARLQAEKFDAVFTDLRMPGMDGLQVAEHVRAAQPWMPVVIVTGYGSPASEVRARAAGVSGFLHKPLSPEMIQDSAEMAVRAVLPRVLAARAEQGQVAAVEAPTLAAAAPQAQPRGGALLLLKNMALFLAAPFIGLVYALLLPFVGLGMLAYVAIRQPRKTEAAAAEPAPEVAQPAPEVAQPAPAPAPVDQAPAPEVTQAVAAPEQENRGVAGALKVVAGIVAAPFIGLAWILLAPIAGIAALAWLGMKAAFARTA